MSTGDRPAPSPEATAALAPTGVLRAAINLSNFLLVTDAAADGTPIGVSPDMASELADALGVPVAISTFPSPGGLADAAVDDVWDVGNIGADPLRAEHIAFTSAYCQIEATYMVPAGSPLRTFADVDQPGNRIAVKARAAYCLWLERNLQHADLVQVPSLDASFEAFVDQRLDALAGLRPGLLDNLAQLPDAHIIPGYFATVEQAIGTPNARDGAGASYLAEFVEWAKASGMVGRAIERHDVVGKLVVAPPAG